MEISFSIKINDDGTIEISEGDSSQRTVSARLNKGNSLFDLSCDCTVIDIETTGLDTKFDEIIELSAIKIRNYTTIDSFHTLVKPVDEISQFITELTGITNEMVSASPPIESALPRFLNFIGDDIVVGHNVHFDVNFIYDTSIEKFNKPFSNDLIDTMRLSRKLFAKAPNYKLCTLAKYLSLPSVPSHRAMDDCEATLHLYQFIENHVSTNHLVLSDLFHPSHKRASQISTQNVIFNEDHPLYKKYCVFTGALDKMIRKDAMQLVIDLGGYCSDSVNKKTNFLVLGSLDYCKTIKDGQSIKLKKAQSFILSGSDIQIISEDTFYDLISNH